MAEHTLQAPPRSIRSGLGATYWTQKAFAVAGPLPYLLVLLVVFFTAKNPTFLTSSNLQSVTTQCVFLLLIALGQMMILVSGGFDLSVGSNVALTSVCSAKVMSSIYGGQEGYTTTAVIWGLVVALAVGLGVGLVNGIGVAVLRVNAFIVTLATMTAIEGVTMLVSGGTEISGLPTYFTRTIGSGHVLGWLPVTMLFAAPVAIVIWLACRWTRYGKSLYAIGSNELAATVAGIRVRLNLVVTYALAGMLTALAGWLLTARVSSGQPQLGGDYVMESITAAIIGGATLAGGRGSVGGTILGVLFIVGLTNGMNLIRLDSNEQNIAIGCALVVSILISRARERSRRACAVAELRASERTE